jgi:hypothetical protein
MSEPRLTSAVRAGALLRLAESQGGFGAVLAKGDPTAGAIGVVLLENGGNPRFFERQLGPDGSYAWGESLQGVESESEFQERLARRRRSDPDLWIIELDIASAERFAAEMNTLR